MEALYRYTRCDQNVLGPICFDDEDFMESLGKESSYSTVKKWAAEFKRDRESVEDD